jgi:hypothetical protein
VAIMGKRRLSITQVILLGCVVVVLVFGATYASMLIPATRQGPQQAPPPAASAQLAFDETRWPVEPDKPEAATVYEIEKEGRHDFWFENTGAAEVSVRLNTKNCKCTNVEIALLPDEMRGKTKAERDAFAATTKLDWQSLKTDDSKPYPVPPHKAGGIRLTWNGKHLGRQGLNADFWTESGLVAGEPISLELSLNLVPPLEVTSEQGFEDRSVSKEASVGTLGTGDTRTVTLICWSSTRNEIGVKVQAPEDPCIRCGAPERLSAEECARLSKESGRPILCAYRVPVSVLERSEDGTQFDLGRFRRVVTVTGEPALGPVEMTITGIVHGEVTVGSPDDREVVDLKSFERHDGKSQPITLSTANGKLELEVESYPDFLQVQLKEEKAEGLLGKTWTLTVTVPPDALAGPVPPHTAIMLKTKGEHPRRLRVPVIGTAYVR